MVFRRYTKKKVRRTRRARRMARRMPRRMRTPVTWMKKEYLTTSIVSVGPGVSQIFNYDFLYTTLPEITQYRSLFDQILIQSVTFIWEPVYASSNAYAVTPYQLYARLVKDSDGGAALTTEQEFLDYSNCVSRVCGRKFALKCYPRAQVQAATGGLSLKKAGWMDIQSPSPTFNLCRAFIPGLGIPTTELMFKVRVQVRFGLKNSI